MSRNHNNSTNPRERKPAMPGNYEASNTRNYSSSRPGREKNEQRISSLNRIDIRSSDRENDLYERQSI